MKWWWALGVCLITEVKGQSVEFKSIFPYSIAGMMKNHEVSIREGVASGVGMKRISWGSALENRFSLQELNALRITAWMPIQKGVGKMDLQTFGSNLYREHRIRWGYGLPVSKTLRLGVEMGGMLIAYKESNPIVFIQSGIDFIYDISTKSKLGFQFLQNHALGRSSTQNTVQRFQTYVGHQVNDYLFVGLESIKESGGNMVTGSFLKWDLHSKWSLWGYLNYTNAEMMVGGQIPVRNYAYAISMSSHPQLGYSLHLMISYAKKKD